MPPEWLLLAVLVAHLAAAGALTGVGWIAQLALYSLFTRVGPDEWRGYHESHSRALGRVVAVPWLVQGMTTVAVIARPPPEAPWWLVWLDAALAAVPVAVTALVAVPLHRRLTEAALPELVAPLLRANLLRTVVWTAGVGTGGLLVVLSVT